MHARDAVAHADNRAHLVDGNGLLVILNLLAQNLADFVRLDVCHARSVASPKTRSSRLGRKTLLRHPLFRRQPRAHLVQAGPQRTIVNRVADAHHRSTEQGRIEQILRLDFLAGEPLERGRQLFFLRRGQFYRRTNFRFRNALTLAQHLLEGCGDLRNQLRAPVIGNHEQEITNDLARAQALDDFFHDFVLRLHVDRWACQERAQFPRLRVRRAKISEFLRRRLARTLLQGDVRQRVCVLQARGLQFGIPTRLSTKLLSNPACVCAVSCFLSSDSAPSTARLAARAFNSSRAVRSAASISAFAANAIFSMSERVAVRMRSTSAAASRSANARSSATSFSKFSSLVSASRSCASAAALALPALVIAEPMASARRPKNRGAFFQHSQQRAPAQIAKLIHLKSSSALPAPTAPPSSAACALRAKKSAARTTLAGANRIPFAFIEPLSRASSAAAAPRECAAQSPRKAARPTLPHRAARRPAPGQRAVLPRRLRRKPCFAPPSIVRRGRRADSFEPLLAPRTPCRAPASALPRIA